MGYIDDYKLRLDSYGGNIEEAQRKNTIDIINNSFADSPFYRKLYISDILTECRVIDKEKSYEKKLLFMPGITKSTGEIAVMDDNNWLLIDSQSNDMFSKALIRYCNETLRWIDENDITQEYPCVITKTQLSSFDEDKYVSLIDNKLYLFVSNDANTIVIRPNTRIILGSQVYEIIGMDDVSTPGLIQFNLNTVGKNDNDDFKNRIADNSGLYESSGGDSSW